MEYVFNIKAGVVPVSESDAVSRDPDLSINELVARTADDRHAELSNSPALDMPHPERHIQDELQELKDHVLNLQARIEVNDREFERRIQDGLRELNDRMLKLEKRNESVARAFSIARHITRRFWLRPPLWTFEQYAPKKLNLNSNYQNEKMPSDAISIAMVTPSFNHGKYLSATIDSVLMQNYVRMNYVVQDGGSSDNTVEILQSYGPRLAWRSERDGGQTQAINRGFAGTRGEIMTYLNSDDILMPGTLAYVAKAFQDRPDVDVIYGHRIFIDRDGMEIGRAVLPRHDVKALYWADYVPQETMFWRRRVWDKVGPFDESFDYALDWDFILRAQHVGFKFLRVPRFLAGFRVHDEQKTAVKYDQGRMEMQRLRSRYLGYEPSHIEVIKNIKLYLLRQLAFHWMYRCRILRY